MKTYIIILFLSISSTLLSQKSDKTLISERINMLFEGMLKSDTAIKALFYKNATLTSVLKNKQNETIIHEEKLEKFIEAISTPHDEKWIEKISNLRIEIDDNFASAWMDYSFFIDETFSHCGVNSIQLAKIGSIWKIISISDTRRRENCN